MKRNNVSKILLLGLMFLLVASLSPVTAFTPKNDGSATETGNKTPSMNDMNDGMEDMHDDMHEIDEHRDSEGTVWIETDVMTVTLAPNIPIYQYWYAGDANGSLARFMVGYMMIVEFEDANADGVYQPNETLSFAPLDAFEWSLQTGQVTNELDEVTELFASYTKGGLSDDWEDDWFKGWMPEIEDESPVVVSSEDDSSFAKYSGMTLRFYGHIYTSDYAGNITDDFGVESNYTVEGGMELKVDIEIGNFPFMSNTSKVAILNYLREDVASSSESEYCFKLHEDHGDSEIDSEDISNDYGVMFEDHDEDHNGEDDDVQQLSFVDTITNETRGLYSWLDKAVVTDLNGTETAVDVEASYWTDGNGLLLFLAYPNFDGGSIVHDPSMRLFDTQTPVNQLTGLLNVPLEAIALIGIAAAVIVVAGLAIKRR
ncbi:MAG: hypothetical protein E4H14_01620 [Candidatus Thorarchaeota archaeon]|nr:MAG: hypothetical protein E4H14_01620 [Candidatus Thorarchaeota archaeon]